MPEKRQSHYVKVSICHKITGQGGIFLYQVCSNKSYFKIQTHFIFRPPLVLLALIAIHLLRRRKVGLCLRHPAQLSKGVYIDGFSILVSFFICISAKSLNWLLCGFLLKTYVGESQILRLEKVENLLVYWWNTF